MGSIDTRKEAAKTAGAGENETQRETIAEKLAKLKHGDNQHRKVDGSNDLSSIAQAAELLNVSRPSAERAKAAIKGGCK